MGQAKLRKTVGRDPGDLPPLDALVRAAAREHASGRPVSAMPFQNPDLDDALERQAGFVRSEVGHVRHARFLNDLRDAATAVASADATGRRVGPPCRLFAIPVHGTLGGLDRMARDGTIRHMERTLNDGGVLASGAYVVLSEAMVDGQEVAEAHPARIHAVCEVAMLTATDPKGCNHALLDSTVTQAIRWQPLPGTPPKPRLGSDRDFGFRAIVGLHVGTPGGRNGIEGMVSRDGRFSRPSTEGGESLERVWRALTREHVCVADAPCTFPEAAGTTGMRILVTSATVLKNLIGMPARSPAGRAHVHWGSGAMTCVLEHEGLFMGPIEVPARFWCGNDAMLTRALSVTCSEVVPHASPSGLPRPTVGTRTGFTLTH